MVLVLAAVDAAAGVYLLAHGVRQRQVAARWVGVALLSSAVALSSTPWLQDDELLPAVGGSAEV